MAAQLWRTGVRQALRSSEADPSDLVTHPLIGQNLMDAKVLARALVSRLSKIPLAGFLEGPEEEVDNEVRQDAQSTLVDRRTVVAYLGARLAVEMDQNVINTDGAWSPVGSILARSQYGYAIQWLGWMTALAWRAVAVPSWVPTDFRKGGEVVLSNNGTGEAFDRAKAESYHPWTAAGDTGLHKDLVIFLSSMAGTFTPSSRLGCEKMAQSCVLLRALGLVDQTRMPPSTVDLLDNLERRLDMGCLKHVAHVDFRMCQIVRSAWDLQVLQNIVGLSGKGSTGARVVRTL